MRLQRLALGMALLASPLAAEEAPDCPEVAEPVITLGFGSRYADDSANRSDFDEEGDKAVTAALKPIDTFITDLAKQTDILNNPEAEASAADAAASCVVDSIRVWAEADALSDLTTQGANLSAPSRVGGIAFAYAAVRNHQPDADPDQVIETWLRDRAVQTMAFFDTEAPPRASQNNLRAWAGLAVARIGLTLQDEVLIDWAADTVELVACTAAPDGSLPNEMWRGRLALHYQLHAVGPLVTTTALLQEERPTLFAACDRALPRVVAFTLGALKDPSPVEKITGKAQSVGGLERQPRNFELAWIPAYLQLDPEADFAPLIDPIEKLGNSKLGGDQRLIWPETPDPATTDG
jgi:poly(beta-D-mannuronate) lyase